MLRCCVVALLRCCVVLSVVVMRRRRRHRRRRHRHRRFCRCCGVVGCWPITNANFMSRVTNSFFGLHGVITIWTGVR